jgi:Ser/Thr protein kinase RdoA (MazF antagonist)
MHAGGPRTWQRKVTVKLAPSPADVSLTLADGCAALTRACGEAGLLSEEAELIRMGENALFRLAHDDIVVRIARNATVLKDATKEVAFASWLRDLGIPAAEPTDHAQPIMVQGHPVTFWHLIDDSGARPSLSDLARILRQLHRTSVPPTLQLPEFDIFDRVSDRITKAPELTHAERSFLASRLAHLRTEYESVKFTLPPAAVHGDAHQSNLIQRPDGKVLLIDFEQFAFGPPESDLASPRPSTSSAGTPTPPSPISARHTASMSPDGTASR